MNYILKYFDKNLIKFRFDLSPYNGTSINIIEIYTQHKTFFPLNLELEGEALLRWIKNRTIPKNRAFIHKILMELELNLDDINGIIDISKSLSLNDCYWIVKEDFLGKFIDYNLYDNNFNKTLALVAYTGYATLKKQEFISSPEFTTNGMLAKAWRKNPQGNRGIFLYKSGSSGFANSGLEPYSEFYASQIALKMGLNITHYNLSKWKKKLNSVCELFSSKEFLFIPIYHLIDSGGWRAVLEYYKKLGDSYYNDLVDMILFDVIILNTDRHFGNFGFLIDNSTNKILKTAPIFDNGLSLFCDIMDDELKDIDRYAKTKIMKNAGDFVEFIKPLITTREKQKIRKLINFKFTKHSTYNLSAKRLRFLEGFISRRVSLLLEL